MTALLFVDLESTSLNPATLTMLEIAWCITDLDGIQRLPLRSRYTSIGAGQDTPKVYPTQGTGFTSSRWANPEHGSAPALRMAEESKLCDDWLACPSEQIITSRGELQRLLLDDIAACCDPGERNPDRGPLIVMPGQERPSPWLREPERLHLAGAGVAQFDQPVLRQLCPVVVPSPGRRGATHYRPVDTSITQTLLLGGSQDAKLIDWGVRLYPDITDIDLDVPPRYAYRDRDTEAWMSTEKMHRAAPDVARSLVLYRALRGHAAGLRDQFDLEVTHA